jgi:hypothetical protein
MWLKFGVSSDNALNSHITPSPYIIVISSSSNSISLIPSWKLRFDGKIEILSASAFKGSRFLNTFNTSFGDDLRQMPPKVLEPVELDVLSDNFISSLCRH